MKGGKQGKWVGNHVGIGGQFTNQSRLATL